MKKRYHITPSQQIKECNAEPGECPFGSENPHFDTEEEAEVYNRNWNLILDTIVDLERNMPMFIIDDGTQKEIVSIQKGDYNGLKNVYKVDVNITTKKYTAYYDSKGKLIDDIISDETLNTAGKFAEAEEEIAALEEVFIEIINKGNVIPLFGTPEKKPPLTLEKKVELLEKRLKKVEEELMELKK